MSEGQSGQGNPGQNRRRHRHRRGGRPQNENRSGNVSENRNRDFQQSNRYRRSGGRVLTSNQVLMKYDNLLENHLMNRRKYYEYFNRVDDRQLRKLEKNFFDSIEHLRRFEKNLEPWQREVLEKRKTERYKLDLTYSNNRSINPETLVLPEINESEIEDPHFTDNQKEAFEAYKDDTEESEGSYEDYLKLKGLN